MNKNNSKDNAEQKRSTATGGAVESEVLLGGSKELVIAHGDERYRLRITARNKLILTK